MNKNKLIDTDILDQHKLTSEVVKDADGVFKLQHVRNNTEVRSGFIPTETRYAR